MSLQLAMATVTTGVVVFLLGQIFQQYVLEPIREFRQIRADAAYYALHFVELVKGEVTWDADERKDVKQMRAGLIISAELIPCMSFLSAIKIFGLPSRGDVHEAASDMNSLSKYVNDGVRRGDPSALKLAYKIARLLRVRIPE